LVDNVPPQITCPYCGNTIGLENRKEVDFEKIMDALGKSPRTFTQLLTMTNLPRKTLSIRLRELCASGSITKDGGYHLNRSIVSSNGTLRKRNGNGKMNQTILHIKKNVQWIPVALIICLIVVAFGSAIMITPPAPSSSQAPTASFFYTPSSDVAAGKTLTFDAAYSSASNGPITEYTWQFGDDSPLAYGEVVTHAFAAQGVYTVTLAVADTHGLTSSTQETVDVSAALANSAPISISFAISPNPNLIKVGWENAWIVDKTLTFNASALSQSDLGTLYYSWNFGDGANGTGVITSHAYTQAGTYTVTLTVTNLEGGAQSISQQVQILPMPATEVYIPQMPTQTQIGQVGDTITLSIWVSNVTDLYTWTAGMIFNPNVLEIVYAPAPSNSPANGTTTTALREGPFLQQNGGSTLWIPRAVTENGVIPMHGCTLTGTATPGVSGSGTLATVEFVVIGAGAANIHLTNVVLIDSNAAVIPVFVGT
jgi:PKD repeat protein